MRYKTIREFDLIEFSAKKNINLSEIGRRIGQTRQHMWRLAHNKRVAPEEVYKKIKKIK